MMMQFRPGDADRGFQRHIRKAVQELEQAQGICLAIQKQATEMRKTASGSVEDALHRDARHADDKVQTIRQLIGLLGRTGHLVQTAEIEIENQKRAQQKKEQTERRKAQEQETKPYHYEMNDGTE